MSQFQPWRSTTAARRRHARTHALLINAADLTLIMSRDSTITHVVPGHRAGHHGFGHQGLVGQLGMDLVDQEDRGHVLHAFEVVLSCPGSHEPFFTRIVGVDGRPTWVEVRMTNGIDDPVLRGVAASISTMTSRPWISRHFGRPALLDGVTGLPSHAWLAERFGEDTPRSFGHDGAVTLILLDVGNLSATNDRFGRQAGDALLRAVAERISLIAGPDDVVARIGSSRFVLVRRAPDDAADVVRLARRVVAAVNRPVALTHGQLWPPAACAGAASAHPAELDVLLGQADLALATARQRGRGQVDIFTTTHAREASARMRVIEGLRDPHLSQELALVYQPVVDLDTGEPIGAEALLRWNHPTLGQLPPKAFIPWAESTGAIQEIGRWVLRTACADAARWPQSSRGPLDLAVNVSASQLASEHFVEDVLMAAGFTDFDLRRLVLEITETAVVGDPEGARGKLSMLAECGVRIAIDDFGTGHAMLTYLKQLPVHVIKIDCSFVSGLGSDAQDTAIVAGVIGLSRLLGTVVTAEGVETNEQRRTLAELGCHFGQGWLFAHPLASKEFDAYVKGRNAWPPK